MWQFCDEEHCQHGHEHPRRLVSASFNTKNIHYFKKKYDFYTTVRRDTTFQCECEVDRNRELYSCALGQGVLKSGTGQLVTYFYAF